MSPSSSITDDHVPFMSEDRHDQGEDINNGQRTAHTIHLRQMFTKTQKTPLVVGILVFIVLCIVVVSSFTNHVPGSWVKFQTVAQEASLQPDYKDAHGGPMELGGSQPCGSYPTQAQDLGCVFDMMNFGWTPPECYYEDISSKFFARGPWRWYLDTNMTVEIPQRYASLGRVVEVYTTRGYHIEHCKWAEAMVKLAEENDDVLIPGVLAPLAHRTHCPMLIEESDGKPLEEVTTWTRMVYNSCVRLSEVNVTSVSTEK